MLTIRACRSAIFAVAFLGNYSLWADRTAGQSPRDEVRAPTKDKSPRQAIEFKPPAQPPTSRPNNSGSGNNGPSRSPANDPRRLKDAEYERYLRDKYGKKSEPKAQPSYIPVPVPVTQIQPTLPQSGKFEVTITGFTVHQQTIDEAVRSDGLGDEVFVRCATLRFDRIDKSLTIDTSLGTKIFGDDSLDAARRVKAGSASAAGGLQTGDKVPGDAPFELVAGAAHRQGLPLQVFSGELIAGGAEVLICPTIWEWDDLGADAANAGPTISGGVAKHPWHEGGENDRAGKMHVVLVEREKAITTAIRQLEAKSNKAALPVSAERLSFPQITGEIGGNRPIGMASAPRSRQFKYSFLPQILTLNFQQADRLAKETTTLRTEEQSQLLPAGVIPIRYTDHRDLGGDYTLFLKIVRIR